MKSAGEQRSRRSAVVLGDANEERSESMEVEQFSDGHFRVKATLETEPAIHVAKYLPRPLRELPSLIMGNTPDAGSPGALASAGMVLPEHLAVNRVPMMPDVAGSGLHQPWRELAGSALLLPEHTAYDLSLQRAVAVELLDDPQSLLVSPAGDILRRAAQVVLGRAQPETLLRVAMHWAFACEVYQRPWAQNRDVFAQHVLSGPEPNRQRLSDAAHRLVMPQTMRVIAADAVCSRRYGDAADAYAPECLSPPVHNLVEAFLPSAVTGQHPRHSEIRTALWILSHGTPLDGLGYDGPAIFMAHTFGMRSIGEPQDALLRWCQLLSLPDDHPHGRWEAGQAPSDLRADLWTSTGLDLRDVAQAVHWVLTTMMSLQDMGNQLVTLGLLFSFVRNTLGDTREAALAFGCDHLITTVEQLQDSLRLDDTTHTDDSCDEALTRRRRIEQHFLEHPFIQFDDGTVVPVGTPDAAYGTIQLCQATHNGQNETAQQRRQRIGNAFGGLFEARIREICHSFGDSHLVIESDAIDRVMDREAGRGSKRADVVIGDNDGNYIVLEATKRNLLPGIRYGDRSDLNSWADDHLKKLEQTTATAEHLRAITTDRQAPSPRRIARLVVGDLPLRQDIGLSAIFDDRSGRRNPPFLCGITEFEMLIEKAQMGFSIPTVILAWQQSGTDMSLGLFLSNHPAT